MTCIVTCDRGAGSSLTVDITQVVNHMTAAEQTKLYKHMARWLSEKDAQRAMDCIAQMITQSRSAACAKINIGEWPISAPIPKSALDRFVKAMPSNVLNVCKIPTLPESEKE